MHHHVSNWLKQGVAMILIACLSICCCHIRSLTGGLSGGQADAAECAVAVVAASSCCSGCKTSDPVDPGGDDEPGDPVKTCNVCCIKGMGQKDSGVLLEDAGLIATLQFPPATAIVLPVAQPRVTHQQVAAAGPMVEPETLVRLHCALII